MTSPLCAVFCSQAPGDTCSSYLVNEETGECQMGTVGRLEEEYAGPGPVALSRYRS